MNDTDKRTRERFGEVVWIMSPGEGSESIAHAFKRITGGEYYDTPLVSRIRYVEGEMLEFSSGYGVYVKSSGAGWFEQQAYAEIYAPHVSVETLSIEPESSTSGSIDDEVIPEELGSLLQQFVQTEKEIRDLKAKLENAETRLAALEEPLSEQMGLNGMQNASVDGMTVFIKKTQYVSKGKGISSEAICELLKSLDRGYMVTEGYNAMSLKSLIKEYREKWIQMEPDLRDKLIETEYYTDDGIPKDLAASLSIGEKISVEARKK